MAVTAGRLFHISSVDNECKADDYIEGTIAYVTLTQYDLKKPNAKVAHALITESEVCSRCVDEFMHRTEPCTS